MTHDASQPVPHAIITSLCLEAGRIMEDTSETLSWTLPKDPGALSTRLWQMHNASQDIQSLIAAAQVLQRRYSNNQD